ncbi:MAG: hypothetical protein DMG81_14980 [Acidobacteria bacterium]|nr:MAG: hypothetical protein DMG81_14980 [Acidobacteriota bacterium]
MPTRFRFAITTSSAGEQGIPLRCKLRHAVQWAAMALVIYCDWHNCYCTYFRFGPLPLLPRDPYHRPHHLFEVYKKKDLLRASTTPELRVRAVPTRRRQPRHHSFVDLVKGDYMHRIAARLCLFLALICLLTPGLLSATGFPKFPQYQVGPRGSTTTGDFNGDRKVDLIVLSQCSPPPCSNSTIAVSLGWGNGRFRPPVISTTEDFPLMAPGSVPVIGDFNGDHKLDIAFIGTASVQGALAVLPRAIQWRGTRSQ